MELIYEFVQEDVFHWIDFSSDDDDGFSSDDDDGFSIQHPVFFSINKIKKKKDGDFALVRVRFDLIG